MTDFAALLRPDRGEAAHPLHLLDATLLPEWLKAHAGQRRGLVEAARFEGKAGQVLVVPGSGPYAEFEVLVGVAKLASLTPWCLAAAAEKLPEGAYRIEGDVPVGLAALGWLLAQHRLTTYKSKAEPETGPRVLLSKEPARVEELVRLAEATAQVRDLVDTPASDLGPAELERAVRDWASAAGAEVEVTKGDALAQGYPMIHAVGAAATPARAPRLIEARWGDPSHPRIAVIGKGVVFDSGGLDLKPAAGMRLMKKDMGGAAHALALARLIVAERLPVRLHLLIPAVENAVSGGAFRPGDILHSRAGLRVEIDNTDAEGRLVLGDALTRAGEEKPELVVDFATLTGAARIALGPDLPATFSNDEALAADLLEAGTEVGDPLWRLPLWDGYDEMLKSDLADLSNSADSPFAGTITAALFLRRFVPEGAAWAHLDTFAWRPVPRPGRPKGGEALGLRAVHTTIARRYRRK
ncbi:leucyl aminopeptidase family protein [Sphingomonas astaxanthinifaciens]|uniref:Leucyl aminopeptidase n=1 Tax=Sphingomonas astaxanthinifaciens DSM 22298 TaxID=1123267 RepID=A0ABQ5Z9K7_9SPHN|nr:leucyl aminopeptidase family protein [Sphingomonas astaxanthinifaciens]GLR48297.1 leucyl aminopeptidase [Sphingomonas astaxanthinifaciens DSM 22298]